MLILAIALAVSMPVGHATNNVHTFFTNATTVGTCGTLCKGLSTTSGSASTATVQTSLAIGSSPALDGNANSKKTGTWSAGSTISITAFATTGTADTIFVFAATSKTTTPIQTAPTAGGFTCDAAARLEFAIPSGVGLSEWLCHTTAAVSSETVTCSLSATPTWGVCGIISYTGAEDVTGTFTPQDKATTLVCQGSRNTGGGNLAPITSTSPINCGSGTMTTLNANDYVVSGVMDSSTTTHGAGTCAGGTTTSELATASTGSLSVLDLSKSATVSATCAGATPTSRWIIFADAIQSKPVYYKVEHETSASLTGTPSTSANSFSGTGWVYNVAGIQNGLFDIQSGTWQIDLTGAVGSPTGTPVARYFVTAWSCTTNSCTTATFLWKNWDAATNVASSTTATLRTYTTASQSQITWTSGNFLAFEVWVAWQYSGTTTTTTMAETTISTAMDFITSGWDYAQSLSGSLSLTSSFAEKTSMFKSLSGSLSSASSFAERSSLFRSLSGSVGSISSLAEKSSLFRSLSGSLSLVGSEIKGLVRGLSTSLTSASGVTEKNSLFRSLSGSLTLAASETKGLGKTMSASLSSASSLGERSSLFRALSGSLTLASSFVERGSFYRSLSGSLASASSLAERSSLFRSLSGFLSLSSGFSERSSLFRSLSGSLSLVASETKGLTNILTGSLGSITSLAEKNSLIRSLSGSLSLAASENKGLSKSMSASLSSASGLAEQTSLFRSLSGSLTLASSFAERSAFFRSLSGSLTLASSYSEKTSLFRSLAGSLGLMGSEMKGFARSLIGSLGSSA